MKRILAFLALASCGFAGTWVASPGKGSHAPAGGGAGNEAFSDDFIRANSTNLGANWTEAAGNGSIASNRLSVTADAYVENVYAYTGTTCDTANTYVRAVLTTAAGSNYPAIVLRYSAAGSPMYSIVFSMTEDRVEWIRKATASDGAGVTVGSTGGNGTQTVTQGDTWAVTIDGTGTSTVVRCWRNPTGNTPTSNANWGGDTTPDITLTDNPASPVDTGNNVGLGGATNASENIQWTAFFGGDTP